MKFELNDYHRNTPDEELINDVKETAKRLGKSSLTRDEYAMNGRFHSTTLEKRFGNWKSVLELSGLETKGHNFKYTFSDEDVVADIKRVADIYGKDTINKKEHDVYGTYHSSTIVKHYNFSWNKILEMGGFGINLNRNFTNEEMFEEKERVWTMLGRQPTTTDIKSGISKYSLQSYARRFGGWRGALQAFVDYINVEEGAENVAVTIDKEINDSPTTNYRHLTNRDINLRLRFKVLQRDNFKCCACGASPAKDPLVELHVDHIKPWSKGGETTFDNLQTLCSKCNLGKSDLM